MRSDENGPKSIGEWPEHRAEPDFVENVMAALPTSRLVKPWLWLGVGGGAGAVLGAVAVLLALNLWTSGARGEPVGSTEGSLSSGERQQAVAIGERVTLVGEKDADVHWSGDLIVHEAGVAFYRVDSGAQEVRVKLPHGEIQVTGTCFTIDVSPSRSDVLVHEGAVTATSKGEEHQVAAGYMIRLTRAGRGAAIAFDRASAAFNDQGSAVSSVGPQEQACPECDCETTLGFPVPQETLEAYARDCRLKTDMAPVGFDEEQMKRFLDSIEAKPSERDVIVAVARNFEGVADSRLIELYIDATGDEKGAESKSLRDMYNGVVDSAAIGEPALVRQMMSRERAGLAQPPKKLDNLSPYEELTRIVVGSAEVLERQLAEHVGADRARELRAINKGWPGRGFDNSGCPRSP